MPRPALQLLLAIVLSVAAIYYWKPSTAPEGIDQETSIRQQTLPKTYLQKTRSWSYDADGNLANILEADSVEQFPRGGESFIVQPRFYSHSGNDRTWTATAKRGRYQDRKQRLLLRQNVVLANDQTGTRLEGHALDIELTNKIARSRKKVTITQGDNLTRADGMIAKLDQETITLGPNVESIYVQQP